MLVVANAGAVVRVVRVGGAEERELGVVALLGGNLALKGLADARDVRRGLFHDH